MDKLDMFQSIFGKLYGFFCWNLDRIQKDAGTQFTLNYFQEGISVRGVHITLDAPDHK